MRLLSFVHQGRPSYGVLDRGVVVDLGASGLTSLRVALATNGVSGLKAAAAESRKLLPLDEIVFLQPITDPEKILCVGINYKAHIQETGNAMPAYPSLFVRFPQAQAGHLESIVCPSASSAFDFEGELAVVIGKRGRHIPALEALNYVAGYSCFADNSLRDWQVRTTQATPGKNFDRSGAFGPWIVTADEMPDPAAETLVTRLNGEEVQRTRLDDMIFSVPDIIAYVSTFTTLNVGDVIATGTPSGVGFVRKPPIWMKAGDVLEVEISGIGTLRNSVISENHWVGGAASK